MKTPIRFSQSWWLTLLTLLLVSLFLSLFVWQLNRGFEKQHLLEDLARTKSTAYLTNEDLSTASEKLDHLAFKNAELHGLFDNEHIFLIDNQRHANQPGYHVMIPFKYANHASILVNRGFIPKNSPNEAPMLAPISKNVTIRGFLKRPTHNWFIFKNLVEKPNVWPKIALEPDIEAFAEQLGYPLFPFVLQLDEASDHGFITPENPSTWLTPEKHWGYAAQWLSFALILLGIYVYFGFKKRTLHHAK